MLENRIQKSCLFQSCRDKATGLILRRGRDTQMGKSKISPIKTSLSKTISVITRVKEGCLVKQAGVKIAIFQPDTPEMTEREVREGEAVSLELLQNGRRHATIIC